MTICVCACLCIRIYYVWHRHTGWSRLLQSPLLLHHPGVRKCVCEYVCECVYITYDVGPRLDAAVARIATPPRGKQALQAL